MEGRGEGRGVGKKREERKEREKKKGARVREEGGFIFSLQKERGEDENVRISETCLVCFLVYSLSLALSL